MSAAVSVEQPSVSPARGFAPGTVLMGRYRVDACIGQGGMGAVYCAEDLQQPGRFVALKAMFVSNSAPDDAPRFQREFRTLSRLQHPHVVAVYDYGQEAGIPFFVMEYLAGIDLERFREQN